MNGPVGVYLINLDRRPDRLEEMRAHLGARGLSFVRIEAVDAQSCGDGVLDAVFPAKGPLGEIGRGDKACSLSHLAALRRFLESSHEAAIVLEDDVEVADDISAITHAMDWLPDGTRVVKLEAYQTRGLRVLIGPEHGRVAGRGLHPLLSRHAGGAGYLITRDGARIVLEAARHMAVPIDHFLFNANVSRLAAALRPLQMMPAAVRQRRAEFGSDIGIARKSSVPTGLAYWRRELVRGLYEINRLHRQVFYAVFSGGKLVRVPWQNRMTSNSTGDRA